MKQLITSIHFGWYLAIVGMIALFKTGLLYPLELLSVFFHELGHGIATFLTGGELHEIVVNLNESGHAISSGGSRFLILSAGYLGCVIFGGIIMLSASRTKLDRHVSFAIGILMLTITCLYVANGIGMLVGILSGAAFIALAKYGKMEVIDITLRGVGLGVCIYAISDIVDDVILRPELESDAHMLADEMGMTTLFWGYLWLSLGFIGTMVFLSLSSYKQPQEQI